MIDAPPLVLQGLGKRFGAVQAVQDLSFTVAPGRVTGFLGPNGSGKTTTLRMLLGLTRPTTGRALVGDRPYAELPVPGVQTRDLLAPLVVLFARPLVLFVELHQIGAEELALLIIAGRRISHHARRDAFGTPGI